MLPETPLQPKLKEVIEMALQEGERYQCPNEYCGCVIEVVRGANPGQGGDQPPRCCCGMEMVKQ